MASHIAKELLSRAHSPDTADNIFTEKVKQRPLVLRPTSPDPGQDARSKRQHARLVKARAQRKSKKPKPLSAKRKRALDLNDVPKEHQVYAIYEPLHQLWAEYMRGIIGMQDGSQKCVEPQAVGPLLASADYHGAIVEVVQSKCPSRVGLRGIIIKDTKFAFQIITIQNELKLIPKEHTTFRFEVSWKSKISGEITKPYVFAIIGSQFETRAADRATKKFRLHFDND